MEDKLKELDLMVYWNDGQDAQQIDFSIADSEDNVAWVWGDLSDVDWECNHPYELIEWGDDDERGECKLCGATCAWSWVPDGVEPTTGKLMKSREPYDWEPIRYPKGLLGDYIKELREKW